MSRHSSRHDLSTCNNSIFLPYVHDFDSIYPPLVHATINGTYFELPMDTGSTGLLIGAPLLPEIGPTEGIPAYEYLTSSGILYTGRLVELAITFHGWNNSFAKTSKIPVLVVDKSVFCRWYDPNVDTFECPNRPGQPTPKPRDTSKITYMGVGFGRNRLGDEQPNAVPGGNPFLNIESINEAQMDSSTMRAGYVISTEGVHLGLSKANTQDFAWVKLEPGTTHVHDPRDWAMVTTCFSINGEGNNCGAGLVDTGIMQMYLRTEAGVEIPHITVPNPNPEGNAKFVRRVKPGTTVGIGFPSLDPSSAARYSFTVGNGSPMHPREVIPEKQRSPPFVNTGRHFLYGFSVAFDAIGGRFGFLPTNDSSPASATL